MSTQPFVRPSLLAAWALLALAACKDSTGPDPDDNLASIRVSANVSNTPINVLVVTVTAADIATPPTFNLTVVDGIASGTVKVPAGLARTFTVTAYNDGGEVTHDGATTRDVTRGQNPPVAIVLTPRSGQVPLTVSFGDYSVVIDPASATLNLSLQQTSIRLQVTVTDAVGQPVPAPQVSWATTDPSRAQVDQNGNVTAFLAGAVDIVATFNGIAGISHLTLTGAIPSPSDAVTQWVVNAITVPTSASQATSLAFDLNGDANADNALGSLLAALGTAASLDFQTAMDAAIASGAVVQLIQFQSDDATLTSDAAAAATWYVGLPTAGYTTGPHQVDANYTAGETMGTLANHDYASANPATTTDPVATVVPLRLFAGTPVFYLPVNGVHLQWHFVGTSAIATGQINGSIRQEDVDNILVPALAEAFNAAIQADPGSTTAQALESMFDTGGCTGAVAGDNAINVCEVATNSLMQTLLAPDVQIYDASGNYAPSAANTNGNALSVGFGFTAVRTSF